MTIQFIQNKLPSYSKDIKLNLSSLLANHEQLSNQQLWGVLVACAMTCKNHLLINVITEAAREHLSPETLNAAKTAAAVMAMNNIYYRFTHLVSNEVYQQMPAQLRMNGMSQHGIDKVDFELFSLAVSAINGCGKCMDAHEKTLSQHGASKETIQAAIKVAAILHSVAMVVEVESSLEVSSETTSAA